jgi:hypothetical protein
MTAKEKAKELVEKMMLYSYEKIENEKNTKYIVDNKIKKEYAIQCALIAVNEIIDALETYDDMTERHLKREFPNYLSCELQNMEQDFRYYEQVKKEIEKL